MSSSVRYSTLRPGLLVSLSTSITGNVTYFKTTLESPHIDAKTGAELAEWTTQRKIDDPIENEAASKVRSKVRSLISAVCAKSVHGLLCPETDRAELDAAIAAARALADDFNATAKLTHVSVNVMVGHVASDDVEAVKAINTEVRQLMELMESGVAGLDVKKVRDAANRARDVSSMLSPEANARVTVAIEAARKAAREIVKTGETVAQEIDTRTIRKIREQRLAFIDTSDAKEVAVPVSKVRKVDLTAASK